MSIIENVSSAIEPGDRLRVKAVAAAILEQQGFEASNLLDLIIEGRGDKPSHRTTERAAAAVSLAAVIVNYLREELAEEYQDERSRTKARLDRLLHDLQREVGL